MVGICEIANFLRPENDVSESLFDAIVGLLTEVYSFPKSDQVVLSSKLFEYCESSPTRWNTREDLAAKLPRVKTLILPLRHIRHWIVIKINVELKHAVIYDSALTRYEQKGKQNYCYNASITKDGFKTQLYQSIILQLCPGIQETDIKFSNNVSHQYNKHASGLIALEVTGMLLSQRGRHGGNTKVRIVNSSNITIREFWARELLACCPTGIQIMKDDNDYLRKLLQSYTDSDKHVSKFPGKICAYKLPIKWVSLELLLHITENEPIGQEDLDIIFYYYREINPSNQFKILQPQFLYFKDGWESMQDVEHKEIQKETIQKSTNVIHVLEINKEFHCLLFNIKEANLIIFAPNTIEEVDRNSLKNSIKQNVLQHFESQSKREWKVNFSDQLSANGAVANSGLYCAYIVFRLLISDGVIIGKIPPPDDFFSFALVRKLLEYSNYKEKINVKTGEHLLRLLDKSAG